MACRSAGCGLQRAGQCDQPIHRLRELVRNTRQQFLGDFLPLVARQLLVGCLEPLPRPAASPEPVQRPVPFQHRCRLGEVVGQLRWRQRGEVYGVQLGVASEHFRLHDGLIVVVSLFRASVYRRLKLPFAAGALTPSLCVFFTTRE